MPRQAQSATSTANALRADIVTGQLKPGAPLRQLALAERYGTSRMPIRQALQQLAAEGFVALQGPIGAHVVPLAKADWDEISAMRLALEPLALKRALPSVTAETISDARALQAELKSAEPGEVGRKTSQMLMSLYAHCQMPRLIGTIDDLHRRGERYGQASLSAIVREERLFRDHSDLLRACDRRDPVRATAVLTRFIDLSTASIATALGMN
ncbi:MAG: GntR family transcriptional regulator [Pseudomonadota bacterium]